MCLIFLSAERRSSSSRHQSPSKKRSKSLLIHQSAQTLELLEERGDIHNTDKKKIAKIDKLAILGIRSFDNTRSETIAFHTPLTLIVGYNGSGKTTIIECLKYATTGDQPPNSKGGAFIHDPKIAGEKEVLAQVKLSFQNTNGAKMVCTRSMQLTVNKTTRTMKTLEGQLLIVKDGERSTVSSRCAELDKMLPNFLGVSRAVLDAVIFCHQEDSMWPMSSALDLKKKFDEIFEAQKYTKAIDNMKLLRKKQAEDMKTMTILQNQYKIDKDRAERAERKSIELRDRLLELRVETDELDRELSDAMAEAACLFKTAEGFEGMIATLKEKKNAAVEKREFIKDLEHDIEILDSSDTELERVQSQYKECMDEMDGEVAKQASQQEQCRQKLETLRSQHNDKMRIQGRLVAEKEHYDRQLIRRQELIKAASDRHSIRGYSSGDLEDEQVQEFMSKIERLSRDQNLNLEKAKREGQQECNKLVNEQRILENKRSSTHQARDYSRNTIHQAEEQIASLNQQVRRTSVDEAKVAILKGKKEDAETNLNALRSEYLKKNWDERIRSENSDLRNIEQRISDETKELTKGTNEAESRGNLVYLKKELQSRQSAIASLKTAHAEKINLFIGDDWTESTALRIYETIMMSKEVDVIEATKVRDGINAELQLIEAQIKLNRDSKKRKQKDETEAEKAIMKAMDTDDEGKVEEYLDEVAKTEIKLQEGRSDLASFSARQKQTMLALDMAARKDCCRMCRRAFADDEERADFVEKMNKDLQTDQATLLKEIKELETKLELLKSVSSDYELLARIHTHDLPQIEAELNRAKTKKGLLVSSLEERDAEVTEAVAGRRDAELVRNVITSLDRYSKEVEHHDAELAKLTASLEAFGGSRTVQEIQIALQDLNEQASRLKTTRDELTSGKEAQRLQISALEHQLQECQMELSQAMHKFEQKEDLLARIKAHQQSIGKQEKEIKSGDIQLQAFQPELNKVKAKIEESQGRWEAKERELQELASALFNSLNGLKTAASEIKVFEENGGHTKLQQTSTAIVELQEQIIGCQRQLHSLGDLLTKSRQKRADADKLKRTVADNIRLRRNKRELAETETEIRELQSKNAEADRDRYQRDAARMQLKQTKLSGNKQAKVAIMKSLDEQLLELMRDYDTDFKDAKKNFHEGQVSLKIKTAAHDDLGKYQAAFDKAVMKFHSLKMDEVNKIVDDLWRKTYKGTDVDTVLIRSEQESASARSLYNYRVCMVKQDAELDMRGRCSAGQKVLASIIIRLALAECFGTNCGLIALDEPTTNLDRDNSRALAQSLHDIIKYRSAQKNFQLIVITHDEEFLRDMKCNQFTEHYYRVSRNERQKSIIERQSIAEVDK